MKKRLHKKLVHEGPYVAEVEVELIERRRGLVTLFVTQGREQIGRRTHGSRRGDLASAARLSRVYSLTPVAV